MFKNFLQNHSKKTLMRCLALTFLIVVGLLGYSLAVISERSKPQGDDKAASIAAGAEDQKTLADCTVTWQFLYEYCGHTVTADSKIPSSLVGLTLKQIKIKYQNLTVLEFSPSHLELQKRVEQYCPDHYILKTADGALGIFQTALGKDTQTMVQRLEIPTSAIPEEYRTPLECGEVFSSMDDVQKYIADKIKGAGNTVNGIDPQTAGTSSPQPTASTPQPTNSYEPDDSTPQALNSYGPESSTPQATSSYGTDNSTPQATSSYGTDNSTPQATSSYGTDDSTPQATSTDQSDNSTPQGPTTYEPDDSTPQSTGALDLNGSDDGGQGTDGSEPEETDEAQP